MGTTPKWEHRMSEQQTTEAPPASSETPPAEPIQLPDDHPLVKTLAEQKKAIRDLKTKAARLDEIEESQRSESEKAADRMAKAEQRAAEAEAKAARRDIAIEHKLSKEDAELLDTLTDEDAMRRLAERLAAASEDKHKNGNRAPREGQTSSSKSDPKRDFLRGLAGSD